MIFATRLLFWADAFTVSPWLILIRPAHAHDDALIAHERTHQGQMLQHGYLLFVVRYLASNAFRQAMEVQAYKVQIEHGASLAGCAALLAKNYWLGISDQEAARLLTA